MLRGLIGICLALCLAPAARADDRLVGSWIYTLGMTGSTSTYVYGELAFARNGTYQDSRRIGQTVGNRAGPYRLRGDQVTLISDGSTEPQTFTYTIGTAQDSKGKPFQALTLKGQSLSYLLSKVEN